ncbi:MAG: HAD-IA family hydrolase [Bdellovibrionota bacterium]
MKKLIIFDCDGTVIDSEIVGARVFPRVWATMGVEMSEDEFLCTIVGTSPGAEVVTNLRARLPANGMEIADKIYDEELARSLQPVEGILSLLQDLECDVCIASNSSLPYLKKVLAIAGLADFFGDRVYSARDLAHPKPAPDVFLYAARASGLGPEDCLVIEDSVLGIRAAKVAGITVVGFMGGKHFRPVLEEKLRSEGADVYCATTDELARWIRLNFYT